MSPSSSGLSSGIPWQMTSFTDLMAVGKVNGVLSMGAHNRRDGRRAAPDEKVNNL